MIFLAAQSIQQPDGSASMPTPGQRGRAVDPFQAAVPGAPR